MHVCWLFMWTQVIGSASESPIQSETYANMKSGIDTDKKKKNPFEQIHGAATGHWIHLWKMWTAFTAEYRVSESVSTKTTRKITLSTDYNVKHFTRKTKSRSYRPAGSMRSREKSGLACLNFPARAYGLCACWGRQQQIKDASAAIDQTSINHAEKFCPGLPFSVKPTSWKPARTFRVWMQNQMRMW